MIDEGMKGVQQTISQTEQCLIDRINHIFSINCIFCKQEGGYGGPSQKILKTKKAGEAISGHFLGQFYLQYMNNFRWYCSHLLNALF